jgi:hypothetical protein
VLSKNLAGKHHACRKGYDCWSMTEANDQKPPMTVKELAAMGGKARADTLKPKRREQIAKDAATARWAKWREERGLPPKAAVKKGAKKAAKKAK